MLANEEEEDLPKSGIRSPGRGEEELGRAQAAREMVNRSLGELKTDTALWGPAGPQTDGGAVTEQVSSLTDSP